MDPGHARGGSVAEQLTVRLTSVAISGKLARKILNALVHFGSRMLVRLVSLTLVLLTLCGSPVRAAVVDWLYDVEVPVEDQSRAARRDATRAALLEMLTRMTGLVDVPLNDAVNGALSDPGRYFVQYRYEQRSGEQGPEPTLIVRFAPAAITRLVSAANLPLWGANRPSVIAWLVTDEANQREILGADSSHPVLLGLQAQARRRGIALVVPLMDLEDQFAVPAAAVYGSVAQILEEGSRRYGADMMLIARIRRDPTDRWALQWEFWMRDSERELVIVEHDPGQVGAAGADLVADELAARYAVYGGETGILKLQVLAVESLRDYGGLMEYLDSLEFIESVQVTEVDNASVLLDLVTATEWQRFIELLELEGRLAPLPWAIGTERYRMTWRDGAGRAGPGRTGRFGE